MHHFLREKIKLNFNNFGLSIRYIVPLSSILTTRLKSTQFAVLKNGKKLKGQKMFVPIKNKTINVTITDTVFLDKENKRLNA